MVDGGKVVKNSFKYFHSVFDNHEFDQCSAYVPALLLWSFLPSLNVNVIQLNIQTTISVQYRNRY
jgi:hypothetical protein